MADNSIPTSYDPIVQLLEDAADGAHAHGAAIGLVHNAEAHIRTDLIALVGKPAAGGSPAMPGFKALWNAAQTNKSAKTAALRTAQSNARLYVRTCIRSLFPVLGESWNADWNAAGFTGGSLAVPANPMTLLQQMRAYYVANPTRESVVQGINCNAATCEATAQGLSDAESASNQSNTDSGTAQANYQHGLKAARARLSGLRDELSQLIADDDDPQSLRSCLEPSFLSEFLFQRNSTFSSALPCRTSVKRQSIVRIQVMTAGMRLVLTNPATPARRKLPPT